MCTWKQLAGSKEIKSKLLPHPKRILSYSTNLTIRFTFSKLMHYVSLQPPRWTSSSPQQTNILCTLGHPSHVNALKGRQEWARWVTYFLTLKTWRKRKMGRKTEVIIRYTDQWPSFYMVYITVMMHYLCSLIDIMAVFTMTGPKTFYFSETECWAALFSPFFPHRNKKQFLNFNFFHISGKLS